MKLRNKTALVTGASRGIGRAIALRLAEGGARVAVNYRSNQARANGVVAQIQKAGGNALTVQGDIAVLADIARVFDQVEERFGPLDVLVNNAGTGDFAPLGEATPDHFDSQFDLNVRGLFFASQRAARTMREGGRIINISSTGASGGRAQGAVYGASKAAVNALTVSLSKALAARQITVNGVSPGYVETDLSTGAFDEAELQRMAQSSPLGRAATPADIADVVAFLASNDARWITGRTIVVDGGAT